MWDRARERCRRLEVVRDITERKAAGLGDYVALLRPSQWIKNVVVFAGPAAGMKLFTWQPFLDALTAFAAFCLAASGTYAINDILDRKADALHPTKKNRPVARGAINPGAALLVGILLPLAAIILSGLLVSPPLSLVILLYFCMTLTYSLFLKRKIIVDVIVIATGFVLRAWGGSIAVGVDTSEWLIACMFTLCMFMGFGKRRCELTMIGDADEAGRHRPTLVRYTPDLLNHLITVSAGIAVITFLLYTLDRGTSPVFVHKDQLFYALPVVVYGIFRFAMLTELGLYSGPTEIILKDRPMQAVILMWTTCAMLVVYQDRLFEGGLAGLLSRVTPASG